jgi:hypothetical protein
MNSYTLIVVFHNMSTETVVVDGDTEVEARRFLVGHFMRLGQPLYAIRPAVVRK